MNSDRAHVFTNIKVKACAFFLCRESGQQNERRRNRITDSHNKKLNLVLIIQMTVFTTGITVLQKIVIAIGAGLCVWGGINLMEGYGGDNPGSKSQGIKQLLAGGGVIIIGTTLVPLLSGLLN